MKKDRRFFGKMVPVMRSHVNVVDGAAQKNVVNKGAVDFSQKADVAATLVEDSIQISIPINVLKFYPGGIDPTKATAILDRNTVRAVCVSALG